MLQYEAVEDEYFWPGSQGEIARRASSPPGELGDTSAWASKRPGPPVPAHAAEPGGAEGRGRAVAAVDKLRDAASGRDN